MNQNKIVLQNAKSQLEAQKQKIFNDAHAVKAAQLKGEIDAFVAQKTTEYNASIAVLKKAYDAAVAEKKKACDDEIAASKKSVDDEANAYAESQAAITQKLIDEIQKILESVED